VLLLPDEQTLLAVGADEPIVLAPEQIGRTLAGKGLVPLAAGAGIRSFTDVLALVVGDEQLARRLAHEPAGARRAPALAASLGGHATAPAALLPPGENVRAAMASWAGRVVGGAASGELPGWRGPAALEAAGGYLSPAGKALLAALLLRAEGRDDEAAARLEEALRLAPD